MINNIHDNIVKIKQKIIHTAKNCGRNANNITLIAVSKKKSPTDIDAAFSLGLVNFGENYVQEFTAKHHVLSNPHIKWHFIGNLQRNKVKEVVGKVHLIQTLDNIKLAQAIDKICAKTNIVQNCLVQVKLSDEDSKHGCTPQKLDGFLQELNELKHVRVTGLMLIGTQIEDRNHIRQEFKTMRELRQEINKQALYQSHISHLSMGMSGDYDIAIEEGATMVRIGTEIFGERE